MRALIVGLGGLGCPVAEQLALSGDVELTLSDLDRVDRSNLPRQWLYQEQDIGLDKVVAAKKRLLALRPELSVVTLGAWTDGHTLVGYDVVFECSDQIDLKFAINDAAIADKIPLVVGGAVGLTGFVLAIAPGRSPCLRCVYEEPNTATRLNCRDAGVLASLPALVASVMVEQARALLLGQPSPLYNIDLVTGRGRSSTWSRRSDCPRCGGACV